MDSILTALDDAALARATKNNFYSFFASIKDGPGTGVWQGSDQIRWRTGIQHAWFSGVLSSQPPNDQSDRQVQEVFEYFHGYGIHTFSWWLAPDVAVQPWRELLQPAGFQYDDSTPGMAMALADLPAAVPHPASLDIRRVEDTDDLPLWSDIFVRGYGLPTEMAAPFEAIFAPMGIELPLRHYLGYVAGEPVAATTLYLGAGVAGIYNVATLPEARRQGLGSALTLHALLEARDLGYLAGILQSSQMGYHVYERLGFRTSCAMEYFSWPAAE